AIKVDFQSLPWTGRQDKMVASIAAGNPPDTVYLNPDFYPQFVQANQVAALDSYVGPGFRDDYLPGPLEAVTYSGKTYGAPILTSAFTNAYNVEVLTASGIDQSKLPTTWDEFLVALKTMTKTAAGQYGAFFT